MATTRDACHVDDVYVRRVTDEHFQYPRDVQEGWTIRIYYNRKYNDFEGGSNSQKQIQKGQVLWRKRRVGGIWH